MVFLAVPAAAQEAGAPFPLHEGERVRVFVADPSGAPLRGTVIATDVDSLHLGGRAADRRSFGWREVVSLERYEENRTAEWMGMSLGALGAGLAAYTLADVLSEEPLMKAAMFPAALVGLVVGGVAGARLGAGWHVVSRKDGVAFRLDLR